MSMLETLSALLVPVLWGLQFVTAKVGVAAIPPLLFGGLRFAAVALLLLPFAGRPSLRELRAAALISLFLGGLAFGLYFPGLQRGSASLSAVVVQLLTPFTVLLAWPVVGERPSARVMLGICTAFAGVVMALLHRGHAMPMVAVLLVMGSAAAQGLGTVLVKRLGPFPPMRLLAWMALFAAPQLLAASLLLEQGQVAALRQAPVMAWLSLAYASVFGTIIAFGLWFWLIARCSLTRVAPFALLQTVVAVAASVLLLDEPVTLSLVAGALVCMAGVALTQSGTGATVRAMPLPPPDLHEAS
jgi:O-acetylserine/cysteine efflux transporter